MTREAKITDEKNEVVNLWRKEFNLPHSDITTRCRISKSRVTHRQTVYGVKTMQKKSCEPPALTRREKGRFLRNFKS